MRAVVDTSVLVSALIRPQGAPGQVLRLIRQGRFTPIFSTPIIIEIIDVLSHPRIQEKYGVQSEDISALVHLLRLRGELVIPDREINLCRDPKDDKFLEAAAAGRADCLVTGDADLLILLAFDGIPILRVTQFLAQF